GLGGHWPKGRYEVLEWRSDRAVCSGMQADKQRTSRRAGNLHDVVVDPKRQRVGIAYQLVPELLVGRLDSEEPAVQLDGDIVQGPIPPRVVALALDSRRFGGEPLKAEPDGDRLRTRQLRRRDQQVDVPVVAALTLPVEPARDCRALQQDAADACSFEG